MKRFPACCLILVLCCSFVASQTVVVTRNAKLRLTASTSKPPIETWWTKPEIPTTTDSTPISCWDPSLSRPGSVEIVTSGQFKGMTFRLTGGSGPDFNYAKIGVSTSGESSLRNFWGYESTRCDIRKLQEQPKCTAADCFT